MDRTQPLIRDVTDTAMWVAAYRADESDRSDALFHDTLARALAGERGEAIAANVKLPAVRIGVVLRTAVLDGLIGTALASGRFDAVLNLAAGLDTRPYRLDVPSGLRWVEVDMPEVITYKERIIGDAEPRCPVERISLDLSDRPARRELFALLGQTDSALLVITEGLLGYLDPESVAELAEDLRDEPHMLEWLSDISGPQVIGRVRNAGDHLKAEGRAQVRFAPAENTAFFEPHGWREVEYRALFAEAPRLGRDSVIGRVVRSVVRFLPESVRRSYDRAIGVVRLGRT